MLGAVLALAVALALPAISAGCGGEAGSNLSRRSRPVPSPSASSEDAGAPDGGKPPEPPPGRDPPPPAPFEDPGCPPRASSPPPIAECDPLALESGCPAGESCFPFVDYPSGPCEVERFGARCFPAGAGTQGDSCTRDACAADHICVSTGRGTQCARLCGLDAEAPAVCSPGLLCLPIDIEGLGACL